MAAYGELKLPKISQATINEFGVFDEWGFLIGVKDDAPEEFKTAWLADKKMYDDAAKQGVIL